MRDWASKTSGLVLLLVGCGVPAGPTFPVPPRIVSFSANPLEVKRGWTSTVSWTVEGADSVTLNDAPESLVGSRFARIEGPSEFTLSAKNSAGERTSKLRVTLSSTTAMVLERFLVQPALVRENEPVEVVWRVPGAVRVTIRGSDGNLLHQGPETDGRVVAHPFFDVTYTLIADGPGGPIRATCDVLVGTRPTISVFKVEPMVIYRSEAAFLSFDVRGATHGLEIVATSSVGQTAQIATSLEDTTGIIRIEGAAGSQRFEIHARGARGEVQDHATLIVREPRAAQFALPPEALIYNGPGGDWLYCPVVRNATRLFVRTTLGDQEIDLARLCSNVRLPDESGLVDYVLYGEIGSSPLVVTASIAIYPGPRIEDLSWSPTPILDQIEISISAPEAEHVTIYDGQNFVYSGPPLLFVRHTPEVRPTRLFVTAGNSSGSTTRYLEIP